CAAICSSSFFQIDRTRNVSRASFFIDCNTSTAPQHVIHLTHALILCHPFGILMSSLWMTTGGANMSFKKSLIAENLARAKEKWIGAIEGPSLLRLETLTRNHRLSIHAGDLLFIGNTWYVTAAGLLNIAQRKHCAGIHVKPVVPFCMPSQSRWAFKATVFRSTA